MSCGGGFDDHCTGHLINSIKVFTYEVFANNELEESIAT